MNKKTLSNYILAFDEINALTAVSYNTASETTEDQTVQVSQIADDILSLLINAYRKGVQAASEMGFLQDGSEVAFIQYNKLHINAVGYHLCCQSGCYSQAY